MLRLVYCLLITAALMVIPVAGSSTSDCEVLTGSAITAQRTRTTIHLGIYPAGTQISGTVLSTAPSAVVAYRQGSSRVALWSGFGTMHILNSVTETPIDRLRLHISAAAEVTWELRICTG
jgi:hypothetical protein